MERYQRQLSRKFFVISVLKEQRARAKTNCLVFCVVIFKSVTMSQGSKKGGDDGGPRSFRGNKPPNNQRRVPVAQVGGQGVPSGRGSGTGGGSLYRETAHGLRGRRYFETPRKASRNELFNFRCPIFPEADYVEEDKSKMMEPVAFICKSLGYVKCKPRTAEGLGVKRYNHKWSDIENESIYLKVNFVFTYLGKVNVDELLVPERMAFHYKGN